MSLIFTEHSNILMVVREFTIFVDSRPITNGHSIVELKSYSLKTIGKL